MPHSLYNSFCQRYLSKIWFLCFQAQEMFGLTGANKSSCRSYQVCTVSHKHWNVVHSMYISLQMYNIPQNRMAMSQQGWRRHQLDVAALLLWHTRARQKPEGWSGRQWVDKVGEGTVQGPHQRHTGSSRVLIKVLISELEQLAMASPGGARNYDLGNA